MENSTVRRLEEEKSVLKKEMEAAKMQALESATNLWKALFRDQDALRRDQSRATEKNLLLEEVPTDEGKVAELQREVKKAEGLCKQIEVDRKGRKKRTKNFKWRPAL